jgi:DNA polymerase III alpha subunit
MRNDLFDQQIVTEDDVCNFYLSNPDKNVKVFLTENVISLPPELELPSMPKVIQYIEQKITKQEFDLMQQQKWFMPNEYKTMDIALYVLNKCNSEAELQRAGEELILFQERDMLALLKYLTYLVETMRNNGIVWGVGRGSSVASYTLYLLGVHKINSMYYGLDISEFLKPLK